MINLRRKCELISVIYNIVSFAAPGQVEGLRLEPGSHNITVNWENPIEDSYCVTHYVIYWEHTLSGSNDTKIVSSDKNTYVIEPLDACVLYEVSVRAENEKNESKDAVNLNTTTGIVGNYHAQIILLYL